MANSYKFDLYGISENVQLGARGGYFTWDSVNSVFKVLENDNTTLANIRVASIPVNINDAASKSYVDGLIQGISPKDSVRVSSGSDKTISSLAAGFVIDGITTSIGDRVLLRAQSNTAENGIYVLSATGPAIRSPDADTSEKIGSAFVFVEEGVSRGNLGYTTTFNSSDILDTDPIIWIQFSAAGSYTASTGVILSGIDIQLDLDGLSTENNIDPAIDTLLFYDDSASSHRKIVFDNMISNIGILTETDIPVSEQNELAAIDALSGTGYVIRTGNASFITRGLVSSTVAGEEGTIITNPSGISGPTSIGLHITGLTTDVTTSATDEFVFYNGTNNRKIDRNSLSTELASAAGSLINSNNLSDLTNIGTARSTLGLVAGGTGDIWVEKNGDTMTGNLIISGATIRNADGTISNPSYTFNSDIDTGMYSGGDGVIKFSTNNTEKFIIDGSGITTTQSSATSSISLIRTGTILANNTVGMVQSIGPNNIAAPVTYSTIKSIAKTLTSGNESGGVEFSAIISGVPDTKIAEFDNGRIRGSNSLQATPMFSRIDDNNTGIHLNGDQNVRLVGNGNIIARFFDGGGIDSSIQFPVTDAIELPDGTTAQRPTNGVNGMFRFNTTLGDFEGYDTGWRQFVTTATTNISLTTISLEDGSVSNPSYTFGSDTDTGMFRSNSGTIGFTSNNASRFEIGTTGISTFRSGGIPGITLSRTGAMSNTDITGNVYFQGVNNVLTPIVYTTIKGVADTVTAGAEVGRFSFTAMISGVPDTKIAEFDNGRIRGSNSLQATPMFSRVDDINTGIHLNGDENVRLVSNGMVTARFFDGSGVDASIQFTVTDAIELPDGTTAQRPSSPANGMLRYNTTLGNFEGYETGGWEQIVTTSRLPTKELFDPNTESNPITLSNTPIAKSFVDVYFDGVMQEPAAYSLSGADLTILGGFPLGITSILIKYWYQS